MNARSRAEPQRGNIFLDQYVVVEADGKILLADVGHFESEQFTIDLLYEYLIKNFNNFAFLKTKLKTNPINYF